MAGELVPKDDVIRTLYTMGMDEFRIAAAIREDVKFVKSRIRKITSKTEFSNPEDSDLANAMRNLAWKAYEEALVTIQFGSPGERLGLIKTIIGRTAGMLGTETTTRFDDMRNEFDEMMTQITGNDNTVPEVDIAEVIASAVAIDSDD